MQDVQSQQDKEAYKEFESLYEESTGTITGPKIGRRHIQIINICFLVFAAYYIRNSLAVAIVAMNDSNASSNADIPTFHWRNKNVILSSFFFGYVPAQIVISCFLHRIRLKAFALTTVSLASVLGLVIPLVAVHLGDKGVIVFRVLQGVTQAFTFPFSFHIISQWIPPSERSLLAGAVLAGRPFATVMAMIVPGFLAASDFGWPWIFYSSNMLSLIWCISFAIFSYDKPANHPRISSRERIYIEKSLAVQNSEKIPPPPYKAILTSRPVWVMTVASIGNVWSFWTLQSQIPMYLNYVMKFKIEKTGALAALPYVLHWLLGYGFNVISNYLINMNVCSVITCRKLVTAICSFQINVGDHFNVSQPTVSRIVTRVTRNLASLRPEFITMPETEEDRRKTVIKLFSIGGLPGIIGALDCTHIKIQSPGGNVAEVYRNRKNWFSINVFCTAFFIPAICLILLSNSGPTESTKAVILLNLAIAINGASFCGYMINPMDLSVKYSGFLMGFSNTFAQLSGFLAPLFVQFVVIHETDPNEWKYVFYTSAGSYIVTGIIFVIFASADIQPWENDGVAEGENEEEGLGDIIKSQ